MFGREMSGPMDVCGPKSRKMVGDDLDDRFGGETIEVVETCCASVRHGRAAPDSMQHRGEVTLEEIVGRIWSCVDASGTAVEGARSKASVDR